MPVVGTTGTKIATPQCVWRASMQRQLGLHLSKAKPALVELAENGETVDFSGDDASNNANHNRRHNACFTAWYNAISAVRVATTQTVLGDKAHGRRFEASGGCPGLSCLGTTGEGRIYRINKIECL